MAVGLNSRPTEWSRPPEPHPPDAGCWCSRNKRRPYVSLIWCSTPSGHGNGLRPWIRTNGQRTAHEPLNLTLDCEHAHVNGRSPPARDRRHCEQGHLRHRSRVQHLLPPDLHCDRVTVRKRAGKRRKSVNACSWRYYIYLRSNICNTFILLGFGRKG